MNKDYTCLRDPINFDSINVDGDKLVSKIGNKYDIIDGIPRFVDISNYSDDFGFQWKKFPRTQLDSYTNLNITEKRLTSCLGFHPSLLKDKLILEAGSGAGRFTEILLKYKAIVHSFDYSISVEANAINNSHDDNLTLVQADIRNIPFEKNQYDFVICLGVLQHTPNPEESIRSLWNMIKPGGYLIIDHYLFSWRTFLPPPFGQALGIYRRIILSLPVRLRFKTVKKLVDFWFPIHWRFRESYFITRILRRISPVIFHYNDLSLKNKEMYYQWSLLDTHDSTIDYYRHTRSKKEILKYLKNLEANNIAVMGGDNGIVASCRKSLNLNV